MNSLQQRSTTYQIYTFQVRKLPATKPNRCLTSQIHCKVKTFIRKKRKPAIPDIRLRIEEDYRQSQLHNEVIQYAVAVSLTPRERQKRQAVIDELFTVLRDAIPTGEFQVFGSYDTGLIIHNSPIDIGIKNVLYYVQQNEGLDRLQHDRACQIFQDLIKVLRKRFPSRVKNPVRIVPQRSPYLELKIDFLTFKLYFLSEDFVKADQLLKDYQDRYWQFKPLAQTLKAMYLSKELLGDLDGGISPYCLYLMIICHLQMIEREKFVDMEDIGDILLDLVRRYAHRIQYRFKAISVIRGGIVPIPVVMGQQINKTHLYNTAREIYATTPRVCIEDPITGRDIAVKMIKWKTIKTNFKYMVKLLQFVQKNPSHMSFDVLPTLRRIWQVDDSMKRRHGQFTGFP
eukprot:TRINITY_DN8608_c0_g2_i2.p1 TRINITY_DN8608_c0_g2~~TRINITY_DN8608_c0_g2_i2.p1  ORF type:complete len:399 (-),score=23.64 TRINITY_DN8608_c0_g2_i2:191-1387(-)